MNRLRYPSRHRSPRHPFATISLTFLLLLLLLPACGRSTGATTGGRTLSGTPSPAASPIPTKSVAVPGPQLTWRPATLPSAIDPDRDAFSRSIAPSNGDITYLCVPPSSPSETTARTYVTRDRAQTWARGADIEVGAQPPPNGAHGYSLTCDIAVDATNPASALITEAWVPIGVNVPFEYTNYATFDFAAHWQKLVVSQPQHFIANGQLASWHGNSYAFGFPPLPGGFHQGIWVSADQMRSWRRLTTPDGLTIAAFWLNPSSGALLMLAADSSGLQQPYRSDDQGATWTAITSGQTGPSGWIVAAPQAGQPWHLCQGSFGQKGGPGIWPSTVSCTADGGQTWTPPQPEFVYWTGYNPKGNGFWLASEAGVFAIAVDDAELAAGDRVYRLPVGATVWQDLGPAPGYTANNPPAPPSPALPAYYPTPAGDVLWAGWMVASYPTT